MERIADSSSSIPCKNWRELLTSVVFAVNFEFNQNFTGFYEKNVEVLDELQDTQNIER